jgi:hypothetical protein
MTEVILDLGQAPDQAFSDAARHCADAVNLHVSVDPYGVTGKWVAVRLEDGRSDGVLYDTKAAAVRHQLHETMCAYVCVPPVGMPLADAEIYLAQTRAMYDAGVKLSDPDRHIVMRPR